MVKSSVGRLRKRGWRFSHLDSAKSGIVGEVTPIRTESDSVLSTLTCTQEASISLKLADCDKTPSTLEVSPIGGATFTAAGVSIPKEQMSILTPTMKPELNLQRATIPVRQPEPGEVVVRIAWTGLCGSDASFSVGPKPGFPTHNHIAGHEGIGHIVQCYEPDDLGLPVALRYLGYACQTCKYCLRNNPTSCPRQVNFPKHHNGSYQQYVTVPRHSVISLPAYIFEDNDGTSRPDAAAYTAALCSGSAALKALKAANPRPGDVVAVFGIGGAIGHLTGLLARNVFAAKVIGVDIASKADDPSFNANSGNAVCDVFLAAPETHEQEEAFSTKLTGACMAVRGPSQAFEHAADFLISCSNRIAGFRNLTRYVCDGGTIIINGGPSDGDMLSVPLFDVVERQINIHGHLMGGPAEMYQCLEYIRAGVIKPHVTEIQLADIPEYLENFKNLRNSGKIVARINGPLISL